MEIDSYAFLPRSFKPTYDAMTPTDDTSPVWAPFESRLAEAHVTLLSSAGLYVEGEQEPFDLDGERQDPNWGDPTVREIPHESGPLGLAHLHINPDDLLEDHDVALPRRTLDDLAEEGVVGGATASHFAVMGYQGRGEDALERWREQALPVLLDRLQDLSSDGVVLAPV